jgi:hypothetical protein
MAGKGWCRLWSRRVGAYQGHKPSARSVERRNMEENSSDLAQKGVIAEKAYKSVIGL